MIWRIELRHENRTCLRKWTHYFFNSFLWGPGAFLWEPWELDREPEALLDPLLGE